MTLCFPLILPPGSDLPVQHFIRDTPKTPSCMLHEVWATTCVGGRRATTCNNNAKGPVRPPQMQSFFKGVSSHKGGKKTKYLYEWSSPFLFHLNYVCCYCLFWPRSQLILFAYRSFCPGSTFLSLSWWSLLSILHRCCSKVIAGLFFQSAFYHQMFPGSQVCLCLHQSSHNLTQQRRSWYSFKPEKLQTIPHQ